MELISIGNVILNLDRVSALDMDLRTDGAPVLRVFTDSPDEIVHITLAPEVPDLLLNLVPQKMRFVGIEQPV